jgi:molybdenum cofactor biosynthesis enzyme MoaA
MFRCKMADKYLMDSNKLLWHLDRINDWKNGKKIAPIHIDVGLSKGCNIRCHYCFGELQGNEYRKGKNRYFPRGALMSYLESAGEVGVRSMAFVGEAEPTLNPHLDEAIIKGAESGIDIALGTNGILFDPKKETMENLTWLRYNISAASEESYRKLHASKDFNKLIGNISKSIELKKKHDLETTVGLQMVLTPLDVDEAVPLAKLGKELGVDYLVIKQCSDTLESELGVYDKLEEARKKYKPTLKKAESLSDENYDVIIKWNKILDTKQCYDNCLGVPFLLYSSGDGKLFPCGMFFEEKYWDKFLMGDLTKQTFKEIIEGDRYWEVVNRVKDMGTDGCYAGCRTHSINEFLWKLKNEPRHVNFV